MRAMSSTDPDVHLNPDDTFRVGDVLTISITSRTHIRKSMHGLPVVVKRYDIRKKRGMNKLYYVCAMVDPPTDAQLSEWGLPRTDYLFSQSRLKAHVPIGTSAAVPIEVGSEEEEW